MFLVCLPVITETKFNLWTIVQKPYLGTKYIESNTDEDIDMKKQIKVRSLPDDSSDNGNAQKFYVDSKVSRS